MSQTVARALLFWLLLFILLQPSLSHLDYLLDLTVKSNAEYLAQKAAVEGTVTPALRQEVLDNLKAVGFSENSIEILYDSSISERGQRIDVTIRAPRIRMFPYIFSGTQTQPKFYYAHAYVMSEYLE